MSATEQYVAEIAALARGMVAAVKIPVTAKMRLGWDEQNLTAPDLVRALDVTAADGGVKVWDGRNSSGLKAASGVYLAHINSGSIKKTLKIAVER